MKRPMKIRAAALQFAVLVAALLAILLASFLALTHTHSYFGLQSKTFLKTIEVSKQGVFASLAPENDPIETSLGESFDNVVEEAFWGGFIKVKSTAGTNKRGFISLALVGKQAGTDPTAVWAADPLLPLVLVGNTKIEGNAKVSDKGIRAGVISGNYFNGTELVEGNISYGAGALPQLDAQWLKQGRELLETLPFGEGSFIGPGETQRNGFREAVRVLYQRGPIELTGEWTGHLIVKSETDVTLTRFSKLTDILVIAPKVTVEKDFRGRLHLLASQQIELSEDVFLEYPSSITLLDKNGDHGTPIPKGEEPILLGKGSMVEGNIIYIGKDPSGDRSNTSIYLDGEAGVLGNIYCLGNMELRGTVRGSVLTERFVYNGFGSRYINHIFNGKLLTKGLSEGFSGLPLGDCQKGIAQWLY